MPSPDAARGSERRARPADSLPELSPASEMQTFCYSGGAVPGAPGAVVPGDMCRIFNVTVAVHDDGRVEIGFRNGTLCAGCALDLGIDGALASVAHVRWQGFVNDTVTPLPAACVAL